MILDLNKKEMDILLSGMDMYSCYINDQHDYGENETFDSSPNDTATLLFKLQQHYHTMEEENKMSNTRIRYSRIDFDGGPYKNTLVTKKNGDVVFFGISRCKLSVGDVFDKAVGRNVATLRCMHAEMYLATKTAAPPPQLYVSRNGLWGWCPVSRAKSLLAHFDVIDDLCADDYYKRYHDKDYKCPRWTKFYGGNDEAK